MGVGRGGEGLGHTEKSFLRLGCGQEQGVSSAHYPGGRLSGKTSWGWVLELRLHDGYERLSVFRRHMRGSHGDDVFSFGSTESSTEEDEDTPEEVTPTRVFSPEPEQAPGPAVPELEEAGEPSHTIAHEHLA